MADLVPGLTTIALLDSLSIIPLCIVFLAVLLVGTNPAGRSFALIAGARSPTSFAASWCCLDSSRCLTN
ncbi:MAG: hypothetical protein GY798_12820 [Hyphomicrobiales bacterium]|nr:hypothetical protein [Hyphomicrobiales bacterium]